MDPIMNVNIASPEFKANPYPFYARLRAEAPVYHVALPSKQTAWLITRYDDVVMALKDERFAKNKSNALTSEQAAKQPWVPAMFKPLEHNMLDLDAALAAYRKRAHSEPFFSDQKSRGFRLPKRHVSEPARLMRLLIASCLAYIWLVYLGVCALRDGWLQRLHRQDRCDLSLFRLGMRLLARCLKDHLPIPDGLLVPAVFPSKPARKVLRQAA